jgi:RNA polymerase sigma factor (sigma-70 family)
MDMMETDRSKIESVLNGNLNAFKAIINDYERLVGHVVFKLVSNHADQEEVCQDVFIKVYQNLSTFKFNSKLSTWIAKIAYNTCLNHLEKKKIQLYDDLDSGSDAQEAGFSENISGDGLLPDELVMNKETGAYLKSEIARLPKQYGTILALYHLDELSYEEIGEIMKMPLGTVKNYLFRARQILKERLLSKYRLEEWQS